MEGASTGGYPTDKRTQRGNAKRIPGRRRSTGGALALLSSAYLAIFASVQGFLALMPLLQEEFLITRAQAGLYTSFYFLSATFVAVFTGRIVDRLGTRRGLLAGVGTVGAMMVLQALAPLFLLILLLAFVTGFAFSIVTPAVNRGVLEIAAPEDRGILMGLVYGGGSLGSFAGAAVLPAIAVHTGWRMATVLSSIPALVVLLLIFFRYRERIPDAGDPAAGTPNGGTLRQDLVRILADRSLRHLCVMGFVFGISISNVTGHYSLFLEGDLGYSIPLAGLGLGLVHVGGIIGQPAWGWITERLLGGDRRRALLLLGCLIGGLLLILGLAIGPHVLSPPAVLAFTFLLGFCIVSFSGVFFTAVSETAGPACVGLATGLGLTFSRFSMVVSPPLFGHVADVTGSYALSWILLGAAVLLITGFYGRRKPGHRPS